MLFATSSAVATVIAAPVDEPPGVPSIPPSVPSEEADEPLVAYRGIPAGGFQALAGETRHGTMVNAMRQLLDPAFVRQAVVVRDDQYADAAAVLPWAINHRVPVLLTNPERLSPATKAYLADVLPDGGVVTIVGGQNAVGLDVEAELRDLGYTLIRYGGETRVETMNLLAPLTGYPTVQPPSEGLTDQAVIWAALAKRTFVSTSPTPYDPSSIGSPFVVNARPGDRIAALYYSTYLPAVT